MSEQQLNRDIRHVVAHCTGLKESAVRPANQDAPATGAQWATILIISRAGQGITPIRTEKNKNDAAQHLIERVEREIYLTVSVNVFGAGAIDTANKIRDRLFLSSTIALMESLALGYISAGDVRNLSQIISAQWEERGQIDLVLSIISDERDEIRTFGEFPFTIDTEILQSTGEVQEP